MPYTPNNNPYMPGDPYSYDLKWLVQKTKDATTAATTATNTANDALTAANNAVGIANSASTAAGNAVNTANSASTAAGNAVNTANSALALAQQDHREKIYIAVDPDANTAEVITDYTWAEIFELCMTEKVRFRMAYVDSFDPDVLDKIEVDGIIWYEHYNDEAAPYSNSYIQIAWIYANITPTNTASTYLAVRKVWLKNSLSGGFYENTVTLS